MGHAIPHGHAHLALGTRDRIGIGLPFAVANHHVIDALRFTIGAMLMVAMLLTTTPQWRNQQNEYENRGNQSHHGTPFEGLFSQ
jgi:hypothetical protein